MRLPLLLAAGVLGSCAAGPSFPDRILATIPDSVEVIFPPAFTPDGLHVAYITRTPEGCRVVRGSWTSRRLDAI
jgi:hypothetical protein